MKFMPRQRLPIHGSVYLVRFYIGTTGIPKAKEVTAHKTFEAPDHLTTKKKKILPPSTQITTKLGMKTSFTKLYKQRQNCIQPTRASTERNNCN